ncbi:zinc finger CCCH-type with G patch domain-containing protein [Leptinotarsa decemlineata]|uniref:zinc finger CCCH-type with G patch domain-containing protein n=1 Tax=Leptinotarsa decemlineata TaxID=7539 RepID=UPI003D30D3AF
MNSEELSLYKQQLQHVNQALLISCDELEKNKLFALKSNIEELLSLSKDNDGVEASTSNNKMSEEFALFMDEMEKEGAVQTKYSNKNSHECEIPKNIEGMKCRAPHQHQWGDVAYHNAMICSVVSDDADNENDFKVRVLFTNPTHEEMLPCPYYFDSDCKFSEEKCRFSHGEVVPYSNILQYVEPKFELLKIGSPVLVKQTSNLWFRAKVRQIYEDKCLVKFESDKKQVEVIFEHVLPLDNEKNDVSDESSDSETEMVNEQEADREDVINQSLLITPSEQALGDWEKYTKGMGSKLMTKMGYITGTGLGKKSDGRIDPVSAVVLPPGKSLDHCMNLRECAGGDKNLFSVEKKLKRIQKIQEKRNQRNYERRSENQSVFKLINKSLEGTSEENFDKLTERQKIKKECSRNLNIKSLQIADNIRRAERDLEKINDSLTRHTDVSSNVHLKLKDKLVHMQDQLKIYQSQAVLIKNEQSLRSDKKKLTIF